MQTAGVEDGNRVDAWWPFPLLHTHMLSLLRDYIRCSTQFVVASTNRTEAVSRTNTEWGEFLGKSAEQT